MVICGGERRGCVSYRIVPITMRAVSSLTMALCLADRSGAPCRLHAKTSSELGRLGIKVNSITPHCTCEGNGGHLARTCFLIVQVLMNRGWLTGLAGGGVNDYAYAQEG